jgi:hypothetical protein
VALNRVLKPWHCLEHSKKGEIKTRQKADASRHSNRIPLAEFRAFAKPKNDEVQVTEVGDVRENRPKNFEKI